MLFVNKVMRVLVGERFPDHLFQRFPFGVGLLLQALQIEEGFVPAGVWWWFDPVRPTSRRVEPDPAACPVLTKRQDMTGNDRNIEKIGPCKSAMSATPTQPAKIRIRLVCGASCLASKLQSHQDFILAVAWVQVQRAGGGQVCITTSLGTSRASMAGTGSPRVQ